MSSNMVREPDMKDCREQSSKAFKKPKRIDRSRELPQRYGNNFLHNAVASNTHKDPVTFQPAKNSG